MNQTHYFISTCGNYGRWMHPSEARDVIPDWTDVDGWDDAEFVCVVEERQRASEEHAPKQEQSVMW